MGPSFWLYIVLPLLTSCAFVYFTQGSRTLPPGPPKLPILGNVLSIPHTLAWKKFAEWGRLYGPVFFLEALGRPIVIVSSADAARDLMERKGANFSDRPISPVYEIVGWGTTVPLMSYGHAQFRKQRRLMQEHLGSSVIRSYDGILEDRIRKFLHRLWLYPDQFCQEIHGHVASILVEAVYGHSISGDPVQDSCIVENERVARITASCGPVGATILDIFPFLSYVPAWIPGMSVKRKALEAAKAFKVAFSLPFEETKSRKAAGITTPSIMSRILDEYEDLHEMSQEEEVDLKSFAGTFYNGGTDTTRTSMTMFFLQMVLNRDIQKRAQSEIDSIVGFNRLPSLNDKPSFKYLDCILKEVLRIHPPAPLAIPHVSIETDEYRGWTIPAQTLVMPNVWHMMRDEKVFPEPEKFDPDRFIDHGDKATDDPVSPVFGFGRRFCPGRALAESVLWLTMASVLAAFDILPAIDPTTGEDVYPVPEFENGLVYFVKPFKCRIIPRKERFAQIVPDS